MIQAFVAIREKLRLYVLLSSLCALFSPCLSMAHEVFPTIADITISDGEVVIDLAVNIEAQLSGIDLDIIADTDDAENAADYDVLRALAPEAITTRAEALVAAWNAVPLLTLDGMPVTLGLQDVDVAVVENPELPRVSSVKVAAEIFGTERIFEVSWPAGSGELVLRQQGVGDPFTGLISGGDSSGPVAITGGDAPSGWKTFWDYIPVGFDHILPKGLDHILFVLGLFFLSTHWKPLLWQISAFTLAHTVTLALGAVGWVSVPASIVEPLIALSIVYVAVENVFTSGLNPWRPAIVFCFGLLHGLGFASVLGEFGLPTDQFIPALIGFNIGVEVGQLAVIALAFLAVGWFAAKPWYRRAISVPASCAIAAVGAFWVVERVFL